MQGWRIAYSVVLRMFLYGAGAGATVGLLYFCVAPGLGIVIGLVGGAVIGIVAGVITATFVVFRLRGSLSLQRYYVLIGLINSCIAAAVTSWVLYNLVRSIIQWPPENPVYTLTFLALPPLWALITAFLATTRVLSWAAQSVDHAGR